MKERPILFSAPMVRALLDGSKTQTRRVVEPQPIMQAGWCGGGYWERRAATITRPIPEQWSLRDMLQVCPYGQPGGRLWCRETARAEELESGLDGVRYLADNAFREIENTSAAADAWMALNAYRGKKGAVVPGIHMPRWASRITLEVTGVRVERLQDISEADAVAEGCITEEIVSGYDGSVIKVPKEIPHESGVGWVGWDTACDWYADLWESINGAGSWDANPWVWVIEFRRAP